MNYRVVKPLSHANRPSNQMPLKDIGIITRSALGISSYSFQVGNHVVRVLTDTWVDLNTMESYTGMRPDFEARPLMTGEQLILEGT